MQPNPDTHSPADTEEENFSFSKLIGDWQNSLIYALRYWRMIALIGMAGVLIGFGYAWFKPVTYTARLTFVVEEAKSGGGSIASAVAGQLGIDIGSMAETSRILAGDNVLELLKSYSLIKKTLLTPYMDSSSKSLADQYAEIYEWK